MELQLNKKPSAMSNEDYLKYLYQNKTEFGLSWKDIADIMNSYEHTAFSEDRYRKKCRKMDLDDEQVLFTDYAEEDEAEEEFDAQREFQSRKELQRLKDERTQLNALYRQSTREDFLRDIAVDCAKIISENNEFVDFPTPTADTESDVEAILEISDWHYGIDIHNHWNNYSPEICKQRIGTLLTKTVQIILDNNIRKIHVMNLGDMISGRIHAQTRIENREDAITQVIKVSELLANFLRLLSKYAYVEYYDCLDNHSRVEPNKKESLRLESLARITTWFLRERFKDSHGVRIHENAYSDDIIMTNVMGWCVAGVHGDLDKVGAVVKNLQSFTHNKIDIICTGHMHHFSADEENGCTVVMNPSLMGVDSFAESKRLFSEPAQTIILVSKNQPVESIHRILLGDNKF